MIRSVLLSASRSDSIESLVKGSSISRAVVARYVAGETTQDAVETARELRADGLLSTIDFLGEDTLDRAQADSVTTAYLDLLGALADAGLAASAEVSVKLSAVGQALPGDGHAIALDNATAICQAARDAGTAVTLDMEDHTTTDATLETLRALRVDFPETGGVLQAYLFRTEADCREFAGPGSRIRLCKGAYAEPDSVAFQTRSEVDRSYVRCMKVLLEGEGYPALATHDPRLIEVGGALAVRAGRDRGSFEYQMLYGVRPDEQREIVGRGDRMRVYVPYGDAWYGYMVRRMAEKPANLALFLRSMTSKG